MRLLGPYSPYQRSDCVLALGQPCKPDKGARQDKNVCVEGYKEEPKSHEQRDASVRTKGIRSLLKAGREILPFVLWHLLCLCCCRDVFVSSWRVPGREAVGDADLFFCPKAGNRECV